MTGQSSLTPAMSGPGRPSPLTPKAPGSPTVDAGVARGRPRPWPPSVSTLARRVRSKDPGFWAVKRSVRAAVVMPAAFGLTFVAFSDGQVSLFAAFGAFALLLLVDFPGRPRTRLVSYVALFATGAVFIALGTVVSTHKVAAVVTMAVVGFIVLFAGIVAPQAATGSTAALLTFVLPVAVAEPPSQIGPRLVGWAIAAALCIPACMLVWPAPWHDELRRRLSAAASAIAGLVRAHAEGRVDPGARAAVTEEVVRLRAQFGATPYPPTGAAPGAVALAKLVGRTEWVAQSAAQVGDEEASLALTPVRAVSGAVADTLADSAALICDGGAHPVRDPERIRALEASSTRLDDLVGRQLDAEVTALVESAASAGRDEAPSGGPHDEREGQLLASFDPSFHARALGVATELVADATLEAAGARPSGERLGGVNRVEPHRFSAPVVSHLSWHSVWFRNSLRGAMGLALAVAVVEVTNVEHGFWVVLGTLSVLRSNALGTDSTALRAVGGTVVGFVVGSAIMIGIGSHWALLWAFLPFAVLLAGLAPALISFAAGQAGFTVVVVILFNIIEPTGWRVGLTRIEDVAIGAAVSVVVGLLFWPRGATAALGRALADAFVKGSAYLTDAVARLTVTAGPVDTGASRCRGARRLCPPRRRLPPVRRRTRGQGGAGRDRLEALHRGEPDPHGGVHPGQPADLPPGARPARARVGHRRRGGAARLVRGRPPLVRGLRRGAGRAPPGPRAAAGPRRDAPPPPAGGLRRRPGPGPGRPGAHHLADGLGR